MFAVLSEVDFRTEESPVKRPFLISVEADSPATSAVVVGIECRDHLGQLWTEKWRNPHKQILPTPNVEKVYLGVQTTRGSLGVPFIYSLSIEGDGKRHIYDAESLFAAATKAEFEVRYFSVMSPDLIEEVDRFAPACSQPAKSYLTYTPFPGALVSQSDTEKSYIIDVDGGGYSDSLLRVDVGGETGTGQEWSQIIEVHGPDEYHPTRENLVVDSIASLGFGVQLRPSSDGLHSTGLSGIAFEGDKRRHYFPAASIVDEKDVPDGMRLLRFSNSQGSMLTLKPQEQEFSGFPSAMSRLMEMHRNDELLPDCYVAHLQSVEENEL